VHQVLVPDLVVQRAGFGHFLSIDKNLHFQHVR
jgi:hypothetical protein